MQRNNEKKLPVMGFSVLRNGDFIKVFKNKLQFIDSVSAATTDIDLLYDSEFDNVLIAELTTPKLVIAYTLHNESLIYVIDLVTKKFFTAHVSNRIFFC